MFSLFILASWERGLNKYTNKLIRQCFPKNMELTNIKKQDILLVMNKLNNRPRNKLKFKYFEKYFISTFIKNITFDT